MLFNTHCHFLIAEKINIFRIQRRTDCSGRRLLSIIDLTVTLEDGENTIFSIKLAADSEYETSYTYNKETRLLEIDRTYCGVTKDVVCVRKFRIEDPAGLKKMRFIHLPVSP